MHWIRIPVGGEMSRARPEQPWGPPKILSNKPRVIPGSTAAGAWI
jgi:hypothetical protein